MEIQEALPEQCPSLMMSCSLGCIFKLSLFRAVVWGWAEFVVGLVLFQPERCYGSTPMGQKLQVYSMQQLPEALQSELSGSCSHAVKEGRTSHTSPNATSAGVILSPVLETRLKTQGSDSFELIQNSCTPSYG